MAMAISMQCGVPCTEYRVRAGRRNKLQRIRARLTAFAAAAAAVLLMAYGEQWMLRRAPASTDARISCKRCFSGLMPCGKPADTAATGMLVPSSAFTAVSTIS